MARAVKKSKNKKNKNVNSSNNSNKQVSNSNLPKIIGAIAGAVLVVGLIVGIVFFISENIVSEKYKNSRSIDYDTIVNVIMENESSRNNYENEFYILVFHSDYDQYPENVFSDTTEGKVQDLIKKDLRLHSLYNTTNVSNANRLGFYTLDLMDSDNEDILNNDLFGNKSEGPFILKVDGSRVTVKSGSHATVINDIISEIDAEISKNQDK